MPRPVLLVLAGVNGAGKSSIGGYLLERAGFTWFNPDRFARELRAATDCDQDTANSLAWHEGLRRLDEALVRRRNYAFETTLGGRTVTAKVMDASRTHDVVVWFCGLSSPELHIARVKARVAAGGHDIPDELIRERYPRALLNLIHLMPHLAHLQVYDNSREAGDDRTVPDPVLLLQMENGRIVYPARKDLKKLQRTPDWAKPLLEGAYTASQQRPPP
ncbi:MAG TPA: AAA family ATPase [Gammaproteobacteria bacterium]